MKVVALAGGVGGARFADGLEKALPHSELSVIINIGDDFDHLGLRICPDLDTVTYTLAGIANVELGWGIADESWQAMEQLERYGGSTWFRLGDRDLGMHLFRTDALRRGKRLTEIVAEACAGLGVRSRVLPVSDAPVPTIVETDQGTLEFQEYFVHRHCEPVVKSLHFKGVDEAEPTGEVIDALDHADLIVFCPSNPFVSIDPILAIGDVRERVGRKKALAVSPIIGGQAVKGPAAKMLRELGYESSAQSVARRYADLLNGFVIDRADATQRESIEKLGMRVLVTDALMKSVEDRARLAKEVLDFASEQIAT